MDTTFPSILQDLAEQLDGEILTDATARALYATDASVYREIPFAVAIPKTKADIQRLIKTANEHSFALIPRTAGTSLAGQCVGSGMVVDVSRHFTHILEIDPTGHRVWVQPGVIRDELNRVLQAHGLFFGPNTSTANRCMVGGMVGNNSSGSTSIKYGVTRDKVLEVKGFLSDGSPVHFKALTEDEWKEKAALESLEGEIYRHLGSLLSDPLLAEEIKNKYPHPEIHRRNTGYALDIILNMAPFTEGGSPFNMAALIAGSEGTLLFITEICLQLDPLPPPFEVLVCAHFYSIEASLEAVSVIMEEAPYACELMDKTILDCTKGNKAQARNRFFVEGDPGAILMIELRSDRAGGEQEQAERLIRKLREAGHGYAWPVVTPPHIGSAWELRKAGLGLLSNMEGTAKAVACIEDTAVRLIDLPNYIREFTALMKEYDQQAIYYAHAGAGELHLRPVLDLKKSKDVVLFEAISRSTAELVKKYRGSLSGEHGDGRVRAAFLPLMYGETIYKLFVELKKTWDPVGIFNPGKITGAAPMTESLRYTPDAPEPVLHTRLDFSDAGGFLAMAEKCNGSGDCRKLPTAGGAMCPSYHATRQEQDTTRGRANVLREFMTHPANTEAFGQTAIYEVLQWCLSCKACAHECPSSVDMSLLKAEFLHQYHRIHGLPFRTRVIGSIGQKYRLAARFPALSNFFLENPVFSKLLKGALGFHPARKLPRVESSLETWYKRRSKGKNTFSGRRRVYFFFDEFTTCQETAVGKAAIQLLEGLGYEVAHVAHQESGRAYLSKGMLDEAGWIAMENTRIFSELIHAEMPLVGVEPSAIYTFRDEYPRLVERGWQAKARELGQHVMLVDDFIAAEIQAGRITPDSFTRAPARILFHGHCHQKALADVANSVWMLSLPKNYSVEVIPSGCCGMAGSFGFEKENYALSQQIGEQVLFPALRKAEPEVLIAATGTSCRHQIEEGVERKAMHPIEIIWAAFKTHS